MRLEELKGSYDAVFSLGNKCLISIQLKNHQLRPYSGVLDWMLSPSLFHVNLLLRNRFYAFMDLNHLVLERINNNLLYRDIFYNITLVHDLPLTNQMHDLAYYPEFRAKMDRRIRRFLDKTLTCQKLLFVRIGGSLAEARELQDILSMMIPYDFRILLINHTSEYRIIDQHCPLEKVCSIQLPTENICNDLWDLILHGVHLVPEVH